MLEAFLWRASRFHDKVGRRVDVTLANRFVSKALLGHASGLKVGRWVDVQVRALRCFRTAQKQTRPAHGHGSPFSSLAAHHASSVPLVLLPAAGAEAPPCCTW